MAMANEGRAETRYASMIEGVGEDDHRALRGLGFSRHEPTVPLRHMYLITCLGVLETGQGTGDAIRSARICVPRWQLGLVDAPWKLRCKVIRYDTFREQDPENRYQIVPKEKKLK